MQRWWWLQVKTVWTSRFWSVLRLEGYDKRECHKCQSFRLLQPQLRRRVKRDRFLFYVHDRRYRTETVVWIRSHKYAGIEDDHTVEVEMNEVVANVTCCQKTLSEQVFERLRERLLLRDQLSLFSSSQVLESMLETGDDEVCIVCIFHDIKATDGTL